MWLWLEMHHMEVRCLRTAVAALRMVRLHTATSINDDLLCKHVADRDRDKRCIVGQDLPIFDVDVGLELGKLLALYLNGYEYYTGSGYVTLPLDQVVHFKRYHPLNAWVSVLPIEALATVAVGDLEAQKWNTNFFGKDNAKVPGALAFKDMIQDGDWKRIKQEVRDDHGGVRHSLMMLRGVGQGGAEWIPMAMSQKEMEFLSSRNFTKEEIYYSAPIVKWTTIKPYW